MMPRNQDQQDNNLSTWGRFVKYISSEETRGKSGGRDITGRGGIERGVMGCC